jgi:hypothetical protein
MTTRKINCSTKCPLDGTERTNLRGLLEDCTLVYGTVQRRRQILRTHRILQEKELLRRIQEPEYRTAKKKSLVYVL